MVSCSQDHPENTVNVYMAAVKEFLCVALGDLQIFVVSGLGKRALSVGTVCFFLGYLGTAKCPPEKNCVFCSSHEIVGKLAYLSVKMMSLDQKHKNCHESC